MGKKRLSTNIISFVKQHKHLITFKVIRNAIIVFLLCSVIASFIINITISTNLENGILLNGISIKAKKSTSLFPFSLKLDSTIILYNDDVSISSNVHLKGFFPLFINSIKLKNINGNIDIVGLSDSIVQDLNIGVLDKWFLLTAPSILSIGEVDIEYDNISIEDTLRTFTIYKGSTRLRNFDFDKFHQFELDVETSIESVDVRSKNGATTIKGVQQSSTFSYDDFQNMRTNLKFSSLVYKNPTDVIKIINFENNISFSFDNRTHEATIVEEPYSGDIFFNNDKLLDGRFLKNLKIELYSKDMFDPFATTKTEILILDKKFATFEETYSDKVFSIDAQLYKRDFNVSQPFLNTINLIHDLEISLLKVSTNDQKFKIDVKGDKLFIKDLTLTPKIKGEIQLANELVIKQILPIVKVKYLEFDTEDLTILGDVDLRGSIKAKYLKLGIFLENFNYHTKLQFDRSLIPNVLSTADVIYKKNVLNINAYMKHKKKKFKGIQDFIDSHKHGMDMKYKFNIKSIFGSKVDNSIKDVEIAGTMSETYENRNFTISNSFNLSNLSIFDTLFSDEIHTETQGKLASITRESIKLTKIKNHFSGNSFSINSYTSIADIAKKRVLLEGNASVTSNFEHVLIKKNFHIKES